MPLHSLQHYIPSLLRPERLSKFHPSDNAATALILSVQLAVVVGSAIVLEVDGAEPLSTVEVDSSWY